MFTLPTDEKTIRVGGELTLLPKEVADALGTFPIEVLAAFSEARRSGASCLSVRFYDQSVHFARQDEPQWDGSYRRYSISSGSECWSLYDCATGRNYSARHLGNLPGLIEGQIPTQPGDSPEVLALLEELGKLAGPFDKDEADDVVYLDSSELDAALAARK